MAKNAVSRVRGCQTTVDDSIWHKFIVVDISTYNVMVSPIISSQLLPVKYSCSTLQKGCLQERTLAQALTKTSCRQKANDPPKNSGWGENENETVNNKKGKIVSKRQNWYCPVLDRSAEMKQLIHL